MESVGDVRIPSGTTRVMADVMAKRDACRESRPVPHYSNDDLWRAVKDILISSADIDPCDMRLKDNIDSRMGHPHRYACRDNCVSTSSAAHVFDSRVAHEEFATSPNPARRMEKAKRGGQLGPLTPGPGLGGATNEPCTDATIRALTSEIHSLELEIVRQRREIVAYRKLVDGFCCIHAASLQDIKG